MRLTKRHIRRVSTIMRREQRWRPELAEPELRREFNKAAVELLWVAKQIAYQELAREVAEQIG